MKSSRWSNLLAALLVASIAAFALWGVWFGTYCLSDGCLGVLVLYGVSLAILLVQSLIVLPKQAWLLHRSGRCARRHYFAWIAISLLAFLIPLALGNMFHVWW